MITSKITTDMSYYWKKKTIVSFLLSIFVVLIHTSALVQYQTNGTPFEGTIKFFNVFFRRSFTLIAVPLFFIISGATFFRNYENKLYTKRLRSRIKTLVIPYMLWNIINMLFDIVTSYTAISNFFIGREKFVLSVPNILLGIFFYKCNGPFWFVFDLIVFVIISPLINLLISKKHLGLFVIVGLLILRIFNIKLPATIFFESESIYYYILGSYIGKHYFNIFATKRNKRSQGISAIFFVVIIVLFVLLAYSVFRMNMALVAVAKMLGALSFWVVADCIIDKVKQRSFMNDSFVIFALHKNVISIFVKLFYLALPKHPLMAIANYLVSPVLTVMLICFLCAFMKKFMSKIYIILTGARVIN